MSGNRADAQGKGGALALVGSDTSVAKSAINNNSAGRAPFGTGLGRGGAIYVDSKSKLTLKASSCSGNTARNAGGCTYIEAGGAESFADVSCENNSAFDGGCAIVNPKAMLKIDKSKIRNNRATKVSRGGGLLVEGSNVTITHSEISANSAGNSGTAETEPEAASLRPPNPKSTSAAVRWPTTTQVAWGPISNCKISAACWP